VGDRVGESQSTETVVGGNDPHRGHGPMKVEQTECSETSAYKLQTPGNYPKESIQHTGHGESFKSRKKTFTSSGIRRRVDKLRRRLLSPSSESNTFFLDFLIRL